MQGNRSRDTKPELRLRSILHRRGLRYRVAARPLPDLRLTADVVFTRQRVAVFVDGCLWHACLEHYKPSRTNADYWVPKIQGNVERDRRFDLALEEAGWTVIRAWEHEEPSEVADRVEVAVRAARRAFDAPPEGPTSLSR